MSAIRDQCRKAINTKSYETKGRKRLRKKQMKTNDKVLTVSADRDLLGRLVIAARSRQIDLKDVLKYELCAIPLSITHADGSLRKPNKSLLLAELEKDIEAHPRLPPSDMSTAYIIDGIAMVQSVQTGGASFFGDLAINHYRLLTNNLRQACRRVDVVFDQYNNKSIKGGERLRRGQASVIEVKIQGTTTPTRQQWKKYIGKPKNKKKNLQSFLTQGWGEIGINQLQPGQKLIVRGGCEEGKRAVMDGEPTEANPLSTPRLLQSQTPKARKKPTPRSFVESTSRERIAKTEQPQLMRQVPVAAVPFKIMMSHMSNLGKREGCLDKDTQIRRLKQIKQSNSSDICQPRKQLNKYRRSISLASMPCAVWNGITEFANKWEGKQILGQKKTEFKTSLLDFQGASEAPETPPHPPPPEARGTPPPPPPPTPYHVAAQAHAGTDTGSDDEQPHHDIAPEDEQAHPGTESEVEVVYVGRGRSARIHTGKRRKNKSLYSK
uniref:Uncharacterized protein n=1 Tax=Branchiostoma floridae TaxID=7739 RepID=C3Y853_BRAFL|eukprot:XP_002607512.1 hypothetical protein BRAFLDRAFT_69943 [Branchiostoma floridae]